MKGAAAVLAAVLVLGGCASTPGQSTIASPTPGQSTIASPTPEAAGSAAPGGAPVTVAGTSTANSDPFTLSGDYAVTMTGTAPNGGLVGLTLRARNDTSYLPAELFYKPMTPGGEYAFSTNISGLTAEEYYLDGQLMPNGGTYTVTFTPK